MIRSSWLFYVSVNFGKNVSIYSTNYSPPCLRLNAKKSLARRKIAIHQSGHPVTRSSNDPLALVFSPLLFTRNVAQRERERERERRGKSYWSEKSSRDTDSERGRVVYKTGYTYV
jgi:hypothetical protein